MKKFLSLLLAAMMLMSCIPAMAADSDFDFNSDTFTITKYNGADTDLMIPDTLQGVPVYIINQSVLKKAPAVTMQTPATLRVLDANNFYGNTTLTTLTLNEGLTTIMENNFVDCDVMEALTIPASVRYIGNNSFKYCDVLTSVRFLGVCPVFDGSVFQGAHSGMVIQVPDDQLEAYKAALPANLNIQPSGQNAVVVEPECDESLYTINAETGAITAYSGNASYLKIPAQIGGVQVKEIGKNVFADNKVLTHVIIPEGVEHLRKAAFDHTWYLLRAELPSTLKTIEENCFWVSGLTELTLPEGLEFIGKKAFMDANIYSVVIPDSVKTIDAEAFSRCYLSDVTLGAGIETIGEKAFYDNSLKTMHFNMETVPTVGAQGLEGKNKEATLTLKDGITEETYNGFVTLLADQFPTCTVTRPALASDFPALDAEAAVPFLGNWLGVAGKDVMGEYTNDYPALTAVLNADGTGTVVMDGESVGGLWYVLEGMAIFAPLDANGQPDESGMCLVTLDENKRMTFDFGFMAVIMEKEGETYTTPAVPDLPWPELDQGNAKYFIGTWEAKTYTVDGETVDASLLGSMTLTLKDDGTATMIQDGSDPMDIRWYADYGTAHVGPTMNDLADITFDGTGNIKMEQSGMTVLLAPKQDEAPAAPEAAIDASSLIGTWTEDEGRGTLTINADGTAVMNYSDGTVSEFTWKTTDNGGEFTGGMWYGSSMTIGANGKLNIGGGWMILSSAGGAKEEAAPAASQDTVLGKWDDGAKFLDVYEDGRIELTYKSDGYVSKMEWAMENGVPTVTKGTWKGCPLKTENGLLIIAKDNLYQEFTRVGDAPDVTIPSAHDPAAAPGAAVAHVPGTADDFIGGWICKDDPTMQLLLLEGEANLIQGNEMFTTSWTVTDGVAEFNGMKLYIQEDWSGIIDMGGQLVAFERGYVEKPKIPAAPAAAPVSTDAAAFLGEWTLVSMAGMNAADLGMTMVLTLNENGTATMFDGASTENDVWTFENGAAIVQGAPLTLNADGNLVMSAEGMDMIFSKDGSVSGEAMSEEEQLLALLAMMGQMEGAEGDASAAGLPENLKPYVGTWHMVYIATGGFEGDMRTMGITGKLILNSDGTGTLSGAADDSGKWYDDEGTVRFGQAEAPLTLLDGGFLRYGNQLSGYMVFSQDETASWSPAPAAPVATAAPAAPAPAAPAGSGFASHSDYMNKRFVAKTYTSFGQTMDASMLGAEYSLFFHENGTCDFGMAGMEVPNLPWGLGSVAVGLTQVEAFVINYYGTMFNAVPTQTGFDMDFYGTMVLHYELAE